jgi:hypothetical protein
MLKRIAVSLFIGALCGAIIGAAGFALSERVFGRGIGMLGNSPSLGALIGAVYLGTGGGVIGAIIGIADLNVSMSVVIGSIGGALFVIWDMWRSDARYFYESGYFDRQMFFSDIVQWMTLVLGSALVGVAVSVLQRKVSGKEK